MSKTLPTAPSGDDRNLVTVDENYLAPTFEDRLRIFWSKNSRGVLAVCALILVAIVAKGGYELYSAQYEKTVAADYAAADTDAKLKSFAAANGDHNLAGLAQLRLADQAYAASSYADARAGYEKAAGILKGTTFGQRARLGAAIAGVQEGKTAEGQAALAKISADLTVAKSFRAEAAYNQASLAAEAGNTTEAIRLIEQTTTIDPEGQWADRASFLRSSLPATTTPAPVATANGAATPAVSLK